MKSWRLQAWADSLFVGVEGGHIIDSDLAVLRAYFELGVRYMTLTHTAATPWADSSGAPPEHNGLTDFGRQWCAR
jgi:membrane dipeptidase